MTDFPARAPLASLNPIPNWTSHFASLGGIYDVLAELAGVQAPTSVSISADAITPSRGSVIVDTEAQAATDTLAIIHTTNLPEGRWLLLRTASNSRTVTVRHQAGGAGQITLRGAADWILASTDRWLLLERSGTDWRELMRGGSGLDGDMLAASYPTLTSLEGLTLAAGDLLYASAPDTLARLAKGSDGQVLSLASGVPAWVASASSQDTWVYNNTLLMGLRLEINSAITTGAMVDGEVWGFLTDELATKTNAGWSSSAKTYDNAALGGTKSAVTAGMLSQTGFANYTAAQMVDGSTTNATGGYAPVGTTAGNGSLVVDWGSAIAFGKWRLCTGYTAGDAEDGLWKVQYSDNGSSWTDAGSTPVNFPGGGVWTEMTWANVGAHRYWRMVNTATITLQGWMTEIELYAFAAVGNMTLIPDAVTATGVPTDTRVLILHKDVSGTYSLNTDLTAEVSRDNGTTWTAVTLADEGIYDPSAGWRILSGTVSLAAQPSGTLIKWRIKTFNAKEQRVKGVAQMWS